MDRTAELALIDEIGTLLAGGTTAMAPEVRTVTARELIGPDRVAAEREVLFGCWPTVIAPSAAVPGAGDFVCEEILDLPLLVVRGADGAVRAFLNVCRHRGNRLCLEASGTRRIFACQYHAWSYDDEGRCRSMVDRDGFAGLDAADFGLHALPVQERHGLIWLLPRDGTATDVADRLGPGLDSELAGYTPHTRHLYKGITRTFPFNWKFGVNTFQELFHLAFLHRSSLGNAFISNVSTFHSYAPDQRLSVIRSTFPEMLSLPEAERDLFGHVALVYLLFPNAFLIWQLDHVEVWRFTPSRDDDQSCDVGLWLLTEHAATTERARRHWERNWQVLVDTVFNEDFATMAEVHRNLVSGAMPEIVYGRNEVGLQDYHRQITAALERARVAA